MSQRIVCLAVVLLSVTAPAPVLAQDAPVAADPAPEAAPSSEEAEAAAAEAAAAEAAAAEAAAAEAAAEAEAAAVEAAMERLRTAHIGDLAARSRAAVHATRPLLRASGELTEIQRSLPTVEAEVHRLAHPARLARIPHLSQRELVDLRAEWRRHGHLLDDWQRTLGERVAELEEGRASLVELRREWAELRDVSEAAGSPTERHERILASLAETRDAAAAMDEARDRYAQLADRITELQIVVEDVVDELRDAATAYHERLLVRDAPPLHLGLSSGEDEVSLVTQAREGLAAHAETPRDLLEELWPAAVGLALLFSALVALLFALARAQAPTLGPPDAVVLAQPSGPFAREVVRRPVASSALLTLLAATLLIDHAPVLVYDLVFFATLIPLWRAVPPLTSVVVRSLVRGAIVFVALDRVQAMLPEGTALLRVFLLIEGVLATAAMGWWLRSQSIRGGARESSGEGRVLGASLVRGLTVLTLVVLLAAVVANVSGFVFLATVLTRGAGVSASWALAISGAVIVIEAVLDLMVVSPAGQRLKSLREHAGVVRRNALRLISFAGAVLWLVWTLAGYGLEGPFFSRAEEILGEAHAIGTLELSLGEVLGAILILVVTSFVLRFVRFVLELDVLPRMHLEPGVDGAVSGLTRYVVGGTGLLFALAFLGIDAAQIALVAGALGVGIGFGLQGIVANFIAGIVLMLERPVRLGDFIEVGSLVGVVDRIGLRSSTIRAMDGAEVIVPNESLISREVINWTLSDRKRRVAVKVGVAYGTEPQRVLEVLHGVVAAQADVVQQDRAKVVFDGFGESSLDFTVQFWAGSFEDSIRLKSDVGVAMYDALSAAGIEIPFPQREVRVVSMPEPSAPASEEPAAPRARSERDES